MSNYTDKVALITGGSSGIGRATALAFAREGAKVVIAARGAERGDAVVREIRAAGGEALFVRTDVSQAGQVEALVAQTVKTYGRLDCAFNNAATEAGVFALTGDFSEEEFDRCIAINLKSVWLCMKYELQQMLGQGGGAIVNTSSVNGLGGAQQGALYSAAKSGTLALTKSAAREYAERGIRVNALVAGAFRTPMLEGVFERFSGGDPEAAKAVESQYAQLTALKRVGRPEEAAEAVLWLCSDAASYVTGHSMIVDGGMTAPFR
ncbi:MAG TPA: glucose 1-dehydrogenase [Blastocatellia bacterium]|nr:glucose 1-dehydrogenase [Blastocatellia bacterium]